MSRIVLTYGTFDLFHVGHLNLLRRAKSLGDYLIVGISTDKFNSGKGKKTIIDFKDRMEIVKSVRYVDETFAESSWKQKISDIRRYKVDTFVIGDDWKGKFDYLKELCEVVYLPRTMGVSSSGLKGLLKQSKDLHSEEMRKALEIISAAIEPFQ